ncbi:hypothetical protein [Candidatus Sororendozoicomonas aggregata]|uniref:hypothetical protein n=1 Tax=Candidatus Sororendozoicomonas aggregata TaxID=3073239 RepID=UPI002ED089FC
MNIICKPGDIVIFHGSQQNPATALFTHTGVIVEANPEIKLLEMVNGTMLLGALHSSLRYGTVYRVYAGDDAEPDTVQGAEDCAYEVAVTAKYWMLRFDVGISWDEKSFKTLHNPYSLSSIFSSALGSSAFGPKAQEYANYLNVSCQTFPPEELEDYKRGFFSGTICSYIPVALYQAVCGPLLSAYIMALDARRVLPRSLGWYLGHHTLWQALGPGKIRPDRKGVVR